MGTEPIQNLAIATALSLLLSGNNTKKLYEPIFFAFAMVIAVWKRSIKVYFPMSNEVRFSRLEEIVH